MRSGEATLDGKRYDPIKANNDKAVCCDAQDGRDNSAQGNEHFGSRSIRSPVADTEAGDMYHLFMVHLYSSLQA
ncbi:hypothetical protein KEM48_002390 [Puccinia striiformis f. sp. tritici PST-130]|nr:hypothetical protein KEM48_002390 [Puccinia striiformis f. sp. tritici PST-130]